MIERVLENWLDSAIERTFQVPFCHMLQAEGYTVVHLTRHCGMELGKDILAIDNNNIPCAFQLKSTRNRRITLNDWRNQISQQVNDLLTLKIVHPSINDSQSHRSFLVTNRELDEEVARVIDDLNRGWVGRGHPEIQLETIVRGQLLDKARRLGLNLWPSELSEIKTFLEMFLFDPRSLLPKEKLASLLESSLSLSTNSESDPPSRVDCLRRICSAALLCSAAVSAFSNENNFSSEIEGWTLFLSYLFACAEYYDLEFNEINGTVNIAMKTIYNSLSSLCEELKARKHFVEGSAIEDKLIYKVRMTRLISLMSVYGIWRKLKKEDETEQDDFIKKFCLEKRNQLQLWGEAAIPQFLAFHWYLRMVDATTAPDFLLKNLIEFIAEKNNPRGKEFIANPYFAENDIIPYVLGLTEEKLREDFKGESYTIESLVHLFARRNWKQEMKLLWPDITKLCFSSFFPSEKWQYYLWRCKKGENISYFPPFTKHWDQLKTEASESKGDNLPAFLKKEVVFFILFFIVYPHRLRADAVRWLDSELWAQCNRL